MSSGKCGRASSRVLHFVRIVSTAEKICLELGLDSSMAVSVKDVILSEGVAEVEGSRLCRQSLDSSAVLGMTSGSG